MPGFRKQNPAYRFAVNLLKGHPFGCSFRLGGMYILPKVNDVFIPIFRWLKPFLLNKTSFNVSLIIYKDAVESP
jgi:hypothetical protein